MGRNKSCTPDDTKYSLVQIEGGGGPGECNYILQADIPAQ